MALPVHTMALLGISSWISLIAGIVQGTTGFGSAIIYQMLWAWAAEGSEVEGAGDLKIALAVCQLNSLCATGLLLWPSAKPVRMSIVYAMIPGLIFCGYLGTWLLVYSDAYALSLVLAAVFLFISVYRTLGLSLQQYNKASQLLLEVRRRKQASTRAAQQQQSNSGAAGEDSELQLSVLPSPPASPSSSPALLGKESEQVEESQARPCCCDAAVPSCVRGWWVLWRPEVECSWAAFKRKCRERKVWGAFATGFASGILNGMFGVGGPPQMIYFALISVDKDTLRLTPQMTTLHTGPVSIITNLILGVYRAELIPVYGASAGMMLLGSWIGARIAKRVNTAAILQLLMLLTFTAALTLARAGDGSSPGNAFLAAGLLSLVVCVPAATFAWVRYFRALKLERETAAA